MEFHVGSRYGSSALDVESGSVLEISSFLRLIKTLFVAEWEPELPSLHPQGDFQPSSSLPGKKFCRKLGGGGGGGGPRGGKCGERGKAEL